MPDDKNPEVGWLVRAADLPQQPPGSATSGGIGRHRASSGRLEWISAARAALCRRGDARPIASSARRPTTTQLHSTEHSAQLELSVSTDMLHDRGARSQARALGVEPASRGASLAASRGDGLTPRWFLESGAPCLVTLHVARIEEEGGCGRRHVHVNPPVWNMTPQSGGKRQWAVGSGQWAVGSGQWAGGRGQGAVGRGQWAVGSGQWAVGKGQWAVGSGQGAVGSGQGAVGRGQWAVGSGQWAVGKGQWAVGSGQWAVGRGQGAVGSTWAARQGGDQGYRADPSGSSAAAPTTLRSRPT
ncbi:uncharacterized protein LOC134542715 [Bacillus rossius redtenbacheri]|uniref:uncharacterized protein LOC134542715 n=1 Tax=Bacillus rossius redtenbacheri TaxID=93214 RepID=UPI002FDD3922